VVGPHGVWYDPHKFRVLDPTYLSANKAALYAALRSRFQVRVALEPIVEGERFQLLVDVPGGGVSLSLRGETRRA
jgi:hypothetical protein